MTPRAGGGSAGAGEASVAPQGAGKGGYSGGATPGNIGVAMAAAEDQLRKEGVPAEHAHAAAAVLVGNAVQESRLNPNAVHDSGTGYGIYGARLERRTKMLSWLAAHGYAKNSLEGQTRYMAHEAMTTSGYGKTRQALMGATGANLGSATSTTMKNFESPTPGPTAGEGKRRGAAATAFGYHEKGGEAHAAPAADGAAWQRELHRLRSEASKPIHTKVALDFDQSRIRDRGESHARRSFNDQLRGGRYASFSSTGVA